MPYLAWMIDLSSLCLLKALMFALSGSRSKLIFISLFISPIDKMDKLFFSSIFIPSRRHLQTRARVCNSICNFKKWFNLTNFLNALALNVLFPVNYRFTENSFILESSTAWNNGKLGGNDTHAHEVQYWLGDVVFLW